MTTQPDIQSYSVRDGTKLLNFEGELLAHISSRRPHAPRWTEMSLYRTAGGTFVFEKIGRSRLVHMPGCPDVQQPLPRFQDIRPGEDPDEGYTYCSKCVGDEYNFTELLSEEDRCSVVLSENLSEIVDALYKRKGSARELPQMAASLLEQAAAAHSELREALVTEEFID